MELGAMLDVPLVVVAVSYDVDITILSLDAPSCN